MRPAQPELLPRRLNKEPMAHFPTPDCVGMVDGEGAVLWNQPAAEFIDLVEYRDDEQVCQQRAPTERPAFWCCHADGTLDRSFSARPHTYLILRYTSSVVHCCEVAPSLCFVSITPLWLLWMAPLGGCHERLRVLIGPGRSGIAHLGC